MYIENPIRHRDNAVHIVSICLLSLCIIFGFFFLLLRFKGFAVDDTYITFRYAENLANGHGLVYNVGETPSEGYTNFLYIVFLAIGKVVGLNIGIFSRILGLTSLIASVWILIKINLLLFKSIAPFSLAMVSGLILLNPQLISHSVSGMETLPYMLSLVLIVYFALQVADNPHSTASLLKLAFSILLSSLIRPEGVLFSFLTLLPLLFIQHDLLKSKKFYTVFGSLFLICLIYFLWRWNYFGYPFPNPFYHKSTAFEGNIISTEGADYVLRFLQYVSPLLLLCFASEFAYRREEKRREKRGSYSYQL